MIRVIRYYLFPRTRCKNRYMLYDVTTDAYVGQYWSSRSTYSKFKFSVGLYMSPLEAYDYISRHVGTGDIGNILLGARTKDGEVEYVPFTNQVLQNLREHAATTVEWYNGGG